MPSAASTAFPSSLTARSWVVILLLCVSGLVARGADTAGAAAAPTIVVLGDSLSAAYGIRIEQGWVSLLQARLRSKGYGHRVVNASSSGETTGGALARLPRVLATHRPAVVVVELGANDGLRGLPIKDIRANLESIVTLSKQAGARILLVGMHVPPNYGAGYARQFHALYADLASKHRLGRVPFLLEDVALEDRYLLDDGLHPNAQAQPLLLERVWPQLEPLLRRR